MDGISKRYSRVYFCIFGGFVLAFLLFFINEIYFSNWPWQTPLLLLPKNKSILSEQKNISPTPVQESQPSQEGLSSVVGAGKDKTDQLVHHLFDVGGLPSPKGLAFSKDGKEIWATLLLNKKRGVAVLDAATGNLIKNINLDNGGGVEILFSQDGSKTYVSQMETAKVYEIDAKTKEILRVFDTKSTWTKEMAFSGDQKFLFASNWVGNDVSELDLEKGSLNRLIKTVATPRGVYATADGRYLYVAGFGAGEIEKIDLESGAKKVIFKSGGAMRHIIGDEQKGILYISDMGRNIIWKLFLDSDKVEKFADTDKNPNTIALSPDRKILFVSCRGINFSADNYYVPGPEWGSVLLFDTETGSLLDAIVGGNQPTALDISSDGAILAFSDFLDNKVEVYSVPSYEVLKNGAGGRGGSYKAELKK